MVLKCVALPLTLLGLLGPTAPIVSLNAVSTSKRKLCYQDGFLINNLRFSAADDVLRARIKFIASGDRLEFRRAVRLDGLCSKYVIGHFFRAIVMADGRVFGTDYKEIFGRPSAILLSTNLTDYLSQNETPEKRLTHTTYNFSRDFVESYRRSNITVSQYVIVERHPSKSIVYVEKQADTVQRRPLLSTDMDIVGVDYFPGPHESYGGLNLLVIDRRTSVKYMAYLFWHHDQL